MALGPAFGAFYPVGNRENLEYETVFLLEAYNQPYTATMEMPCSRRHRFVKIREEIVRNRNKGGSGGAGPAPGSYRGAEPPGGWQPPR